MTLPRLSLQIRDELLDRFGGRGIRHAHQVGLGDQKRHRSEIPDRIVAQRRIQELVGGHAGADDEDGVAVGVGMGDHVGRDVAAGAGLVLDHHRLAPDLLQAVADQARGDVGRAARRERHHDLHRFCRPVRARARERRMQARRRQWRRGRQNGGDSAWAHSSRGDRPIASGHAVGGSVAAGPAKSMHGAAQPRAQTGGACRKGLFGVVFLVLCRDDVGAGQPAVQVDVAAARRAERRCGLGRGLAADRARLLRAAPCRARSGFAAQLAFNQPKRIGKPSPPSSVTVS